ncbi:ligase-associated DNA damage response endonuclease PdeM [Legionella dresdenensis]|uniref:Ligase-associated DNA damage response endonuclease PdeM n=1 Tax=Legionella dresdenensis TaxID=450200 RepID=A0ABV8CDC0_9GAMM
MRHKSSIEIVFAGHELILDANACLFWPAYQILIVSDLHLEKGSFLARHGSPLPLHDTLDTLLRLQAMVEYYQPKILVSLGDNVHDWQGLKRMLPEHRQLLAAISAKVVKWLWIIGNHDQNELSAPELAAISCVNDHVIDSIILSHDKLAGDVYQIIGHYHPCATINAVRGKCFAFNQKTLVMPAFGSYTGGLDIASLAFEQAIGEKSRVCLIHRQKIWRVK